MQKLVTPLCATALAFTSLLAVAGSADESDQADKQRITRAVPPLLTPCGSIERITVSISRGKQDPFYAITHPKTIALICNALRNTIQQGRFQIGHQFHSPSEVRQIVFIRQGKPSLRLKGVGNAMYWMAWGEDLDGAQLINFRSQEFDDFASEYFRPVDTGPAVAADFSLEISRLGCEGKCPVYSVRLDADGTVSWNGRAFVAAQGAARRTVSRWQVHALIQRIKDRKLLSLKPVNLMCVDTAAVEVRVRLEGRTASLKRDSCAWTKTPDGREIAAFSQFAESLMGTEHWVR
jgi:hypothetical protein